jgi:hypothetical protein
MIDISTRSCIKTLLRLGRSQAEASRLTGVSLRTVSRIAREPEIASLDDRAERQRRRIGRPSAARSFKDLLSALLEVDPGLTGAEVLQCARFAGYRGSRSTMYSLVGAIRRESERSSTRS